MKKQMLGQFETSELIYGSWRINESNLTTDELITFLEKLFELDINTIDTAEIYGGSYHRAEEILGNAFKLKPDLRKKFVIITKTGIVAGNGLTPHYDNTFDYIVNSVEKSLEALCINKIDILLLHRPDILCDFEEIYRTFKYLLDNNKVAEFGVSNYSPIQFSSLYKFLNKRGINLVTNQIELNNFSSEHYDNDNTFFLKGEEISPMIWSPMGGGKLFEDNNISKGIEKIADKYNTSKENIVISFLHNQGLNPCTILGSHKIQRYEDAIDALELQITPEEKYKMIKLFTKKDIR